jgi:hypothetical protein
MAGVVIRKIPHWHLRQLLCSPLHNPRRTLCPQAGRRPWRAGRSSSPADEPATATQGRGAAPSSTEQPLLQQCKCNILSMYSAGVAAALALAEEIARSGPSSQNSDAPPVHAAAASSIVRVRNGLVASREKSIDSSLVRCILRNSKPVVVTKVNPPLPACFSATKKPSFRPTILKCRAWAKRLTSSCR